MSELKIGDRVRSRAGGLSDGVVLYVIRSGRTHEILGYSVLLDDAAPDSNQTWEFDDWRALMWPEEIERIND